MIGVAANDPTSVAVANTAADQLRNVGIAASVQPLDPVVLYGDAVPNNRVDAVVGWHAAGGDLATELASRYGCRALGATSAPNGTTPTTPSSTTPFTSAAPTPVTPASGPAPRAGRTSGGAQQHHRPVRLRTSAAHRRGAYRVTFRSAR